MRISPDVMELVELLNDTGFGALAGELMTEISLGKETDSVGDANIVEGTDGVFVVAGEAMVAREPFRDADQLGAALAFLELRLAEPARRMAEAEQIAGELAARRDLTEKEKRSEGERTTPTSGPVRIRFRPPADRDGEVYDRAETAGEERWANALTRSLRRLAGEPV